MNKKALNPWGVICSFLFDPSMSSDEVCRIVGLAGLGVDDWSLTEKEAATHAMRKRAYLPRVQAAYERLPDEKKLIVAWIVATELAKKNPEFVRNLNSRLDLIGWRLESDRLIIRDINLREMFFPKGTQHDAYIEIRQIIQQCNQSLIIIDPYIDGSIFRLLSTIPTRNIEVQLLSFRLPSDFSVETRKFLAQYPNISLEVRTTAEFHDRFIIADHSQCYHIGASIKDAGIKAFMINQIEDPNNMHALIEQQHRSWNSAKVFRI